MLGLVAFVAVAFDHGVGLVRQPLAGGNAGTQLLLILFDFARLTLTPGAAALFVWQVDYPSRC